MDPPLWNLRFSIPKIILHERQSNKINLSTGDKLLVKTKKLDEKKNYFSAELIRPLKKVSEKILGITNLNNNQLVINPVNRFFDYPIYISNNSNANFKKNQIVEFEIPYKKTNERLVINKIEKTYGDSDKSDLFSFLSAKEYGLPDKFPNSVTNEINNIKRKKNLHEINLTKIAFVTIDPINAKDRDDAIYVKFLNTTKKNKIFCEIWIAIADVSSFFEIGSKIDNEALFRGNSTYLNETVIPMLPEKISNNLCSLEENKVRYTITLKIDLDEKGNKLRHTFYKGKIKVKYNLNYEEVEELINKGDKYNNSKVDLIKNLNRANILLKKKNSTSLNLKISEPKIETNTLDKSLKLNANKTLSSHKLVENFMIIANTCVGETLSKSSFPIIYRYHEKPNILNLNKLNKKLSELGFGYGLKKTHPTQFNEIFNQKIDTHLKNLISIIILQNMSQAYYSSDYSGHYGLSLNKYVHFTSPIRRYADLIVHRQLHALLGWDSDENIKLNLLNYNQISAHISSTERKSIKAERQTHSRYLASFMIKYINQSFEATIYSVTRNKVFFFLKENHIQGECVFEELNHYTRRKLKRKKEIKKLNISLSTGDTISVKLISTNTYNGNLVFEYEQLLKRFMVDKKLRT